MKYTVKPMLKKGTIPNYYDFETWYIMEFGYKEYLKTKIKSFVKHHHFSTVVDYKVIDKYWKFIG